jgi:hypothetical protein
MEWMGRTAKVTNTEIVELNCRIYGHITRCSRFRMLSSEVKEAKINQKKKSNPPGEIMIHVMSHMIDEI